MRTKILSILQEKESLTLTQIQNSIDEDKKNKPLVLYHLRHLVNNGNVRRNEDKTYTFISENKIKTINITYFGEAKAGANDVFRDENATFRKIPVAVNMISHDPKDLLLVKVSGSSMEPTFQDGNLLMFRKIASDRYNSILDNQIIFCRINDGFKIKRYKNMGNYGLLLSDNYNQKHPDNHPIVLDDIIDFEPLGRYISTIN
jgi:SOS-response transcriptional repressor LexA